MHRRRLHAVSGELSSGEFYTGYEPGRLHSGWTPTLARYAELVDAVGCHMVESRQPKRRWS